MLKLNLMYWMQIASLTMTVLGAGVAIYVALGVRTLHILINSRLTQLLKSVGDEQRAVGDAAGVERERAEARDRKNVE